MQALYFTFADISGARPKTYTVKFMEAYHRCEVHNVFRQISITSLVHQFCFTSSPIRHAGIRSDVDAGDDELVPSGCMAHQTCHAGQGLSSSCVGVPYVNEMVAVS